jgi:hypothetical protein
MLLLAALLHLAGATALPVLHGLAAASSPRETAMVAVAPGGDETPSVPAHDESSCLICQTAHTVGVPAGGAEIVFSSQREASARAEPSNARPAERGAATLARAPPALS